MINTISSIIDDVCNAPNFKTKVEILQKNDHIGLRKFLQIMLNKDIKWLLPEGDPPYTPNPYLDQEGMMYAEIRRLYLFMEGGNPNLKQSKREQLFVEVLESLHPNDAKLLLQVKNNKCPRGVTPKVVNAAFPGLIPEKEEV